MKPSPVPKCTKKQREFNLVKRAMKDAHLSIRSLERFIDNLDPTLVDASVGNHTKLTMSVTEAAQRIIANLQAKVMRLENNRCGK